MNNVRIRWWCIYEYRYHSGPFHLIGDYRLQLRSFWRLPLKITKISDFAYSTYKEVQ